MLPSPANPTQPSPAHPSFGLVPMELGFEVRQGGRLVGATEELRGESGGRVGREECWRQGVR